MGLHGVQVKARQQNPRHFALSVVLGRRSSFERIRMRSLLWVPSPGLGGWGYGGVPPGGGLNFSAGT